MTSKAKYQLYYWPLPFRGCFVSYLFAYRDVPLLEETDFDEINRLRDQRLSEQPVPFMGPPILRHLETKRTLSQMPAIVLHVATELNLMPEESFDQAMCMKILMDCNDVLMEICRYNGSSMWEHEDWVQFRSERLPRWLHLFEESLARGHLGRDQASYADIATFALFGNMTRCLPELETDFVTHAPGVHALCQTIGSQPSLADRVAAHESSYGKLYCGGYIEKSIRHMLELDQNR